MKSVLAYSFAVVTTFVGLSAQDDLQRSFAIVLPDTDREEFKKVDQSFMFFKTFGKCPYAMHYDPAINQLSYTFLGCLDTKTENIVLPRKGAQLATLIPVRFTQKFLDANVQIDRKYSGYRETFIGKSLEGGLKALGVMSDHQFEGSFMINEYKNAVPMKWVLRDMTDLKGLITYLKAKFTEENIVPTKKPLLLLEIVNNTNALDAADLEFLNTYFEILDPLDSNVKAFFSACQDTLNDAMDVSKDAKYVLESFSEMVLRDIEKGDQEFKGKELAVKMVVLVAAAFTTALIVDVLTDLVIKPTREKIKNYISKPRRKASLDDVVEALNEVRDRLPDLEEEA